VSKATSKFPPEVYERPVPIVQDLERDLSSREGAMVSIADFRMKR